MYRWEEGEFVRYGGVLIVGNNRYGSTGSTYCVNPPCSVFINVRGDEQSNHRSILKKQKAKQQY